MKKQALIIPLVLLILILSVLLIQRTRRIPEPEKIVITPAEIEKALNLEKRVSFNFKDVPLKAFFGFLSKRAGVEIVLDKEVRGIISLKTEATTLRDILDRVTKEKNLKYEIKKGAIYITKA